MNCLGRSWVIRAGAALAACLAALDAAIAEEVDVALVLAADVSGSMTAAELHNQRDGLASAFRDPALLRVIQAGPLGRVAVSYVEWAGPTEQWIVVPWFVVSTPQDASLLAERIAQVPDAHGWDTSVSAALLFASQQFDRSDIVADRKVIDVSGDGPNNAGPPVDFVRDLVVAAGITINGLPMNGAAEQGGPFAYLWEPSRPDIGRYYEDCVTGGVNAFTMPVTGPEQFQVAIRRKLVLEIASRPPPTMPAGFTVGGGDDAKCGVGSRNG